MKEYLLISLIVILMLSLLDKSLKTNLYKNKKFWILQTIVVALTTISDSYSSGKPIVTYNPDIILGIKILHVPIENYLFGFSLITLNIILFEWNKKRLYGK